MARTNFPSALAQQFAVDGVLAPLVAKAQRLHLLDAALRRVAPDVLHCQVANMRQAAVIVQAPSGAVAAKLKHVAPRLLAAFKAVEPGIESVKIEVRLEVDERPPSVPRELPPAPPAGVLDRLTESLPPSALRDALRSLADKSR